jgi:hypothetical protein
VQRQGSWEIAYPAFDSHLLLMFGVKGRPFTCLARWSAELNEGSQHLGPGSSPLSGILHCRCDGWARVCVEASAGQHRVVSDGHPCLLDRGDSAPSCCGTHQQAQSLLLFCE